MSTQSKQAEKKELARQRKIAKELEKKFSINKPNLLEDAIKKMERSRMLWEMFQEVLGKSYKDSVGDVFNEMQKVVDEGNYCISLLRKQAKK